MSIEAVKKVEIFPMNKSSNSNTWSPEEGTNVLVFNIFSNKNIDTSANN